MRPASQFNWLRRSQLGCYKLIRVLTWKSCSSLSLVRDGDGEVGLAGSRSGC
jgi:hypothetical protein